MGRVSSDPPNDAVLRCELFEVAAMPRVSPGIVRLPRHVEPAEDEALVSWLARLGADLELSPLVLGSTAFGVDGRQDPEWWRRPSDAVLAQISARTGLPPARLRAMTLLDYATARSDEAPERLSGRRWVTPASQTPHGWQRGRRVDVCRQCLAEDTRPCLRRLWMLGWAGACPTHRHGAERTLPALRGRDQAAEPRCPRPHQSARVPSLREVADRTCR